MRAILMYHSVDASGSPISVTREQLAAHVRWLAGGRVRVVPLAALPQAPDDSVAVTFDDGFTNFATDAWPLLREAGLPVTLFVVAGRAGRTNDWNGSGGASGIPVLPLLDWHTLGRLADEGVDIGAHTQTHPRLTKVDDARLGDEVGGSAEVIAAQLGRRPSSFAYPYGDVDGRVAAAARQTFLQAVTTELAPVEPACDARLLPRLDAYYFRDAGRLEAWGTAAFRRRLAWRGLARRARQAVMARMA
jgi:peptidoglycan/xylan/chitin deacetylase (PgdA/CDA1 family)